METSNFVLRPQTLGEILDQSFRLYRRNFLTFVGIVAVVQIPSALVQMLPTAFFGSSALTPNFRNDEQVPIFLAAIGLGMLLIVFSGLAHVIANGAVTRAVLGNYLGNPPGVLESYRQVVPKIGKLLAAFLLLMLINVVTVLWWLVPCVGWLTGLGILFSFGALVSMMLAPVIVVEQFGAWQSIRRAWSLVRRRFWWMLGFAGVLWLMSMLITAGPVYALNGFMGVFADSLPVKDTSTLLIIRTVIQAIITSVSSVLYMPLQLTAMTVVYFDLRIRTEGLDLALGAVAESGMAVEETHLSATAILGNEPFLTTTDAGNFLAVSILAMAAYAILYAVLMALMMALFMAFL